MSQQFPYQIQDVDTTTEEFKDFNTDNQGFIQIGDDKWFLFSSYRPNAPFYYNFQARPDDIWIVTFPRSGTTLTGEMVWLLANNLDYKTAAEVSLEERNPFLEVSTLFPLNFAETYLEGRTLSEELLAKFRFFTEPGWKVLEKIPGRRIIKTHLPLQLLPPNLLEVGCKVIYVARNPKDVAISFYKLDKMNLSNYFRGDFPKYWESFTKNHHNWAPYWTHVKGAWQRRHEKNLLFMFYEDMNKNMLDAVKKTAAFIGHTYSDEKLLALTEHLKVDNFKNYKSVNHPLFQELGFFKKSSDINFIGKGKVGGWRDWFDEDLNKRADEWIVENLKNSDIKFPPY